MYDKTNEYASITRSLFKGVKGENFEFAPAFFLASTLSRLK